MANQNNSNQFREDEIVIMSRWDKRSEEWVKTAYPKIGGRLRLAHEDNDQLSITTNIIKYDEGIAVVMAVATTIKGSFPGYGMASVERDRTIAPAILELAETRAIARSLRFAGYGVEYCSAEEISHLENATVNLPIDGDRKTDPPEEVSKGGDGGSPGNSGNSGDRQDDRGNGRISAKQHKFILNLIQEKGMTKREFNERCLKAFEKVLDHLNRVEASEMITELLN
jgi:hypothetical protein